MEKRNDYIMAAVLVALGVLFILLKGEVISIALTILAVGLLILGIIDLVKKAFPEGIVKIILAIVAGLFAWLPALQAIAWIVLAVLLIVWGAYQIYLVFKNGIKGKKAFELIMLFLLPVLSVVAGILILLQGAGWIFIVIGIVLIIEGLISFFDAIKK